MPIEISWDDPGDVTDALFGELRSLLQRLGEPSYSPSHMFRLLRQGIALSPAAYEARWRPYVLGYQEQWPSPLLEVATGAELTRAGHLVPGAPISVHPWRVTLGDIGAAEVLESPAIVDVCELHLRDQAIRASTVRAITAHEGLTSLEVLDLTNVTCSWEVLEDMVMEATLPALRVLRLEGRGLGPRRLREMIASRGWSGG